MSAEAELHELGRAVRALDERVRRIERWGLLLLAGAEAARVFLLPFLTTEGPW